MERRIVKHIFIACILISISSFSLCWEGGGYIENAVAQEPDKKRDASPTEGMPTLLERIGLVDTRPLADDELGRLNIKNGLVIYKVEGLSAAAGVRAGDILVSINGRDANFGKIQKLPQNFPNTIVLFVFREDSTIPIAVQLPRLRHLF